ncbi:MAG: ABC transporter permease, partial [Chloroflexi bacterium]
MKALGDLVHWLTDPANWQGSHGIPVRVFEHIELSAISVILALLIAMPIALYLGHTGRAGFIAINVANVGRALPSLALLAFGLVIAISLGLGLGFWPTVFALVPL